MTDFRALCAELADSVELLLEMRAADAKPMAVTEDRLCRARAALAQPKPQRPTDEDIEALMWQHTSEIGDMGVGVTPEDALALVRAVLDRWGASAPCPYVVSSDEGTSYCRLAEHTADQLAKLLGEGGG